MIKYIIFNIITVYSQYSCSPNFDDQSLFLSLKESLHFGLAAIFRGKNLQYSLVGKVAQQFQIQQSMHLLNSKPFLAQQQYTLIQQRPLLTSIGQQQVNSFAILIEIQGEYRIYYSKEDILNSEIKAPSFNQYVLVATQKDNIFCHDFDYIDADTFIVGCLQSSKYYLVSIDKNSIKKINIFDISGNHQDLKQIKLEILNQDNHNYLLIGYPTYAVQSMEFVTDCQIDVFKLDIFNNPSSTSLQINKELLKIIYKSQYAQLNLMDFKISAKKELIIFDKQNATIQLKLDTNANQWIDIRFHNPTNGDYKSFGLYNDQKGDTQMLLLYNTNQIMTITQGYIQKSYKTYFDFDEQYPKVQYSEQYIVILDNHVLRILAQNQDDSYINFYLYEKELPNIKGFILNPHINDLVIINTNSIERYTISQGYLLMKPFTEISIENQSFQIVASNPISECQTRINYAVYSNIDSTIYPGMSNTEPISDTIFYPIIPQYSIIRIMANSGPNQQMECKIQSDFQSVHISTDFKKPLQVKGLQNYNKKNVVSALFSVNPGQNSQLFFILQFDNKGMYDTQIYYCTENTVYQFLDCNIINELTSKLETKLNQNLFSLTYESHYRFNITMAFVDQKIVHIYGYLLDGLTFYQKFTSNNYIHSIIISDPILYIFYRSIQQIQLYDYQKQQNILIINRNYMTKLGFTQLWKPDQFECNVNYNPAIFAVVNGNSVIIMRCVTDCIIMKIIPFNEPTQLSVNIQTNGLLVVFYFRYDAQQILEYDLRDLYFIRLNKEYELYHYILMEPIQFFKNPIEEYFYIAAYTPLKKQNVILVFKSGLLLRESLQTIIETKKYFETQKDLVFSISGQYSKFQYLNNGDEEFFYIFTNNLQSSISLSQEFDPVFIHEAQINSTFFNIDLPTRQEYQQTIKFVYLQTDIDVNEQFRQGLKINFDQVQDKTKILIAQDWFHGQIADYSVKCEQCKNQITVTQPIEIIVQKDFGDTKFIDKCYLGINNVYAHLTKNNIMFLDSDYFEALQLIPLNIDSQYTCNRIFCSPLNSWLFLYCESREYQGSLQLFDCQSGTGCKRIGTIKDIFDIYALNSLIQVNDNIILLSQEYASQSMISIYRITIFEDEWQLIPGMKITKKEADQSFQITDIKLQQYKVNGIWIFKLFLTENSKGMLCFDLILNNKILVLSGLIQNMNLKGVIKENNLYVSAYSQYLNILITSEMKELISDGITEFHLLIVTQSEEHYGLRVQFKGLLLYKIIIAYLLHPFAGWPTNQACATLNGYVILSYNSQYESITLMSVYKIPEILKNDLRDSPTLMYGGILFPRIYNVNLNIGLYSEEENQISVNYNTNSSILEKAFIHKQGFIQIKDIENIYEQTITLKANNYFYQNEIKIDLTQGEKIVGFNYMVQFKYIIYFQYLVYVGGAILIFLLVVAFIFIYCRRKNKVIDVVPLLN